MDNSELYNWAFLSSSGRGSIEKDSWSALRADRRRQRQARLHTVGLWWPRARGQTASLCVEFCQRPAFVRCTQARTGYLELLNCWTGYVQLSDGWAVDFQLSHGLLLYVQLFNVGQCMFNCPMVGQCISNCLMVSQCFPKCAIFILKVYVPLLYYSHN